MKDIPDSLANHRLAARMLLLSGAMFGFGFALVPLYDVFCSVTGLNGKTDDRPAQLSESGVQDDRLLKMQFLSNPGTAGNWGFRPESNRLEVHPGRFYTAHYLARNPTDRPMVVRAVPSVAPGEAAQYLHKNTCFCFSNQVFAPGQQRRLTLRFMVDPAIPRDLSTLSLAYTLYLQDSPVAVVPPSPRDRPAEHRPIGDRT